MGRWQAELLVLSEITPRNLETVRFYRDKLTSATVFKILISIRLRGTSMIRLRYQSTRLKSYECEQWRNQVHFTGEATRGQALFKGGQQFNDIISNDVISGVARNFKRRGSIISTFFGKTNLKVIEKQERLLGGQGACSPGQILKIYMLEWLFCCVLKNF